MSKSVKIEGFFTNHSLRQTGTTRLFRQGVDRKLVKEYTGHSSDAVDQYQITSDEQREKISNVIGGEFQSKDQKNDIEVEFCVSEKSDVGIIQCQCKFHLDQSDKVGSMTKEIMEHRCGSKTKIKLEIEFSD